MLRTVTLQVLVEEVNLEVYKGSVLAYDGHLVGDYDYGGGKIKSSTVVWKTEDKEKCKMAAITKMRFQTRDGKTLYNHQKMVQLQKLGPIYDAQCDVTGYKTDVKGIILVRGGATLKLREMSEESVSLNAQYQTQLNFIDSEITRKIQEHYTYSIDPKCRAITDAVVHKTRRLRDDVFMRNLGDLTVTFKCSQVVVQASNTTEKCYKQLAVVHNGERKFLDVDTRILIRKGTETFCSLANIPVVRDTRGVLFAYDPKPRNVKVTGIQTVKEKANLEEKGIYPAEAVESWLEHAFLQGFEETAALMYEVADGSGLNLDEAVQTVQSTFQAIRDFDVEEWVIGRNWEAIGRKCSIIVVAWMFLQVCYRVIIFMVLCGMGYNLGIPFWTCVWAAVFPDVHTLRKWNQINGNKEQDEKEESA